MHPTHRIRTHRSYAAMAGAVLWGLLETAALARSRWAERLQRRLRH